MKQIVYVASPESQQIHVWRLDSTGALHLLQTVAVAGQVQPMTIAPNGRHLYVGVRPEFAIISYRITAEGMLEYAGRAPIPGSPTHIETDRQGHYLFCASYSFNSVSVSPIDSQGIVQAPIQQIDGLQAPHSANIDPTNHLVVIPCLKEDHLRLFDLAATGQLTPHSQTQLSSANGAGPRHMAFHPLQPFAYCINELNGTVDVYHVTDKGMQYQPIQTLDAMPEGFSGTRWAADIHILPNGRYLYTSDRTASLLSLFQVADNGTLTLLGHHPTEMQPRGFNIDHTGHYLISAGQKSHHIEVYQIDQNKGQLQTLARYPVGQGPMWVSILALRS